jgi:uncharacterized membrane protein
VSSVPEIRVRLDVRHLMRALAALRITVSVVGSLRAVAPEILTATAFIAGWLLITKGVADLTRREAWFISIGLLLLSLCGWSLIRTIVTRGLYLLSVKRRDSE